MIADFATVAGWLAEARLPVADLAASDMNDFLIAETGAGPVGAIGLEQYAGDGLLRSLIVDSGARAGGIGRQLVAALEKLAASRRVTDLWLLTTDADRYFGALGYAVMGRDDAPEAIRGTVEFSKLCPGDAVLMKKRL